jgi:hypothetical protein
MVPDRGAPSDKQGVDWAQYAEDARAFLLATSSAIPTAMRVWTVAWCDWMTSAAETQDQLARRWNSIIRDPAHGGAVLNAMREDVKQYILDVAGIPERSVLDFLVSMSDSGTSSVSSAEAVPPQPDEAFIQAADDVLAKAADALSQLEMAREAAGAKGEAGTGAAAPDVLASLRERMSDLNAARARLKRGPAEPAL